MLDIITYSIVGIAALIAGYKIITLFRRKKEANKCIGCAEVNCELRKIKETGKLGK